MAHYFRQLIKRVDFFRQISLSGFDTFLRFLLGKSSV
jgi:hypothetical protein